MPRHDANPIGEGILATAAGALIAIGPAGNTEGGVFAGQTQIALVIMNRDDIEERSAAVMPGPFEAPHALACQALKEVTSRKGSGDGAIEMTLGKVGMETSKAPEHRQGQEVGGKP
jgi:hypothetical protein